MKKFIVSCFALFIGLNAMAQSYKNAYTLVVTNAKIVDVVSGKVTEGRLLAINGNTIKAVDDTKQVAKYKADRYLDAQDKFVMPGLWDMHIHLRGGDSLINENKNMLPLFLAFGVTTVRECGGDIYKSIFDWRKQIAAGTLDGPRIFTCGPKLDGPKPTWAGSLEVETPEQISKALDSVQHLNADFVKIYDSKISADAFLGVIDQSEKRGMKTTGHMPYTVKLTDALDKGLDGSEHLYYIFKSCSSKEDSLTTLIREREHTARPIGLFGALPSLYDTYDDAKADKVFHYLADKKFTITPTLFVSKTLAEIKETDHTKDTLLAYIGPKVQATYAGRVRSAKRATDESTAFTKKFDAKCAAMVPKMYAAGINIIAGSDCGASNSFVYPGASLHGELKLLVEAGLTPQQALTASVINGPKFFGIQSGYGSLQAGKCSDLILLDSNPLENISAIDHIGTVISNGKVYTRKNLDGMMAKIKH